jgi:hypothetical protein
VFSYLSNKQGIGSSFQNYILVRRLGKSHIAFEINNHFIQELLGIRRTDHATPLYPQNVALTSPTSGGRSVGIVRSRTQATELVS